jgi:hypothetical protein
MYLQKAVDFDSINYLPGFPSLSLYSCSPDSWNPETGGCSALPVAVGRELAPVSDATSMALAVVQAQNKMPARLGSAHGDRHRRVGMGVAAHERNRNRGMGGCGCGGSCGGCGDHGPIGMGMAWTDIVTWLESNWMPLLIGGGVVWFLKRR